MSLVRLFVLSSFPSIAQIDAIKECLHKGYNRRTSASLTLPICPCLLYTSKSGTSVESCSLLLQASLHFTTDIFPAKSRVRICKHFVNELPSPAVRCCDFFSVFMASQQRDYDIPMVTLALPLVRLDRSVFPPLPLLQSQKRFLAKSQIVF